jgi:hypothetical protein
VFVLEERRQDGRSQVLLCFCAAIGAVCLSVYPTYVRNACLKFVETFTVEKWFKTLMEDHLRGPKLRWEKNSKIIRPMDVKSKKIEVDIRLPL